MSLLLGGTMQIPRVTKWLLNYLFKIIQPLTLAIKQGDIIGMQKEDKSETHVGWICVINQARSTFQKESTHPNHLSQEYCFSIQDNDCKSRNNHTSTTGCLQQH
jgi:hypothetical protein